jgi:2,4-dienoyl-CoA reductase (NADPH2)
MMADVEYLGVDDRGLSLRVGGVQRSLDVDHVIVCAGQESVVDVVPSLEASGKKVHVIGGARVAGELDARRAILEGARVGAQIGA